MVEANSLLAHVECEGDRRFSVRSHVKGKLVEVNERLVSQPQLLGDSPLTLG